MPNKGQLVTILNRDGSQWDGEVSSAQYIIRKAEDSGDSNIVYYGYAIPGTATSASTWRIFRLDKTSGLIKLFADGVTTFTKEWDERENYTYS